MLRSAMYQVRVAEEHQNADEAAKAKAKTKATMMTTTAQVKGNKCSHDDHDDSDSSAIKQIGKLQQAQEYTKLVMDM
jgi:hypothetical protein